MIIPLQARFVDLANLVVAKGSNFLLTVLLFSLLSHGMDSASFAEFGYWWSIAIMIGGVMLGGLSSALVRVAAVHGSLKHLVAPLWHATGTLLLFMTVLSLYALYHANSTILLFVAVALFGLMVQAQTVVLALLRAAEATRTNLLASIFIVLLVPLSLHLMLGTTHGSLSNVFSSWLALLQ